MGLYICYNKESNKYIKMIKKPKINEIKEIKKLVDSSKEMDIIEESFSLDYYERILDKGILLIAEENNKIVGVCFGTYNKKEKWADLLGLIVRKEFRKKGVGSGLVKKFERTCKKYKLKTIDLYSDKLQLNLFRKLKYKQGRIYISFRKKL